MDMEGWGGDPGRFMARIVMISQVQSSPAARRQNPTLANLPTDMPSFLIRCVFCVLCLFLWVFIV